MHSMIVDGRAIARLIYKEIQNEISHMGAKPHLTVFTCAPNFETQKYLSLKRKKAHEVGIGMTIIEFPSSITTEEVVTSIRHAPMQTDGIVVQLPFPAHIDIDTVLSAVPQSCDVDAIHYDGSNDLILPPVVGAIREIALQHDVLFAAQHVVVVGQGKLVGTPASVWCKKQGAKVTVVTKETPNRDSEIASAHILILGAGQPGLIVPEMVREGVVIFDAGTSEEGGILKGDASPECAKKAQLFTPVPGGIGPITVALLLRNLVALAGRSG
jgi:methylenetetrahydrofolate dehydrogenase (NADP+) / methenyltetrahydrofolate cyclohydrolase